MPTFLIYAVILFTIALVFYTWGVWAERLAKRLKPWHAMVFAAGVGTDVAATWITYAGLGGLVFTAHSIMGFISLALMAVHFIWALIVLARKNEAALTSFHKLSLFVWTIWMISYLSGFVLGMMKLG